ncbi:MAG: diguanylate cyclase [Synechococcaceae cyanobacterium ELA739]
MVADVSAGTITPADFMVQAVQQLRTAMLPIDRLSLALVPVESGCNGIQYWWRLEEQDTVRTFLRMAEFFEGQDHRTSVLHHVCCSGDPERVRLLDLAAEDVDFPLLSDLQRDRFTDYLALPLPLTGSHRVVVTLATRHRDGFRSSQLRCLYRLLNPLVLLLQETGHFGGGDWQSQDPLTGLISRRRFEEQLQAAMARGATTPAHLSVLLLDLDDFSAYNSVFGHFCADDVLVAVARLLSGRFASPAGSLARIGSDAFGLFLPGVQESQLEELAEALLRAVQDLRIAHPQAPGPFLGCSIGVATARVLPGQPGTQARQLMERAEQALLRAKLLEGHQHCKG